MLKRIFITGKLAYPSLNKTLSRLNLDFDYQILKMPITVAALMDSDFIIRNLKKSEIINLDNNSELEIILPGRSRSEIEKIKTEIKNNKLKFIKGPEEIIDLPEFFGKKKAKIYFEKEKRDHKIIAEINEAALMDLNEIIKIADYYHNNGADIIDLGCVNGRDFPHLEEVIYSLKEKDYKLSIDTFNQDEIIRASKTGIDYLLSINSHNIEVLDYDVSYLPVIIPDPEQGNLKSLFKNIEEVEKKGLKNYIIDPILDPINFGFSQSLFRYLKLAKNKNINKDMMMGVGNLIELSDCDSTGLNFLTAALAVELNIEYLLTTEASFKTRGAVKELDLALKIISHAQKENSLPNKLSNLLFTLKDRKDRNYNKEEVKEIKDSITDSNYRILNDGEAINIFNAKEEYRGKNIGELFSKLKNAEEPSHAFYLGKELQKAYTALNLSKNYRQEDELNWGYLNSNFEEKKNDN
jgi:dihydropteroate synthase-like protein